jgi:hypothetical protein
MHLAGLTDRQADYQVRKTTYTGRYTNRAAAITGRSPIRAGSRSDDGNIRRAGVAPGAAQPAACTVVN